MKKFLWACVLALPLTTVSQQNASACGFEIHWAGGCDWHFTWGIRCGNCCNECNWGTVDGGYASDCSSYGAGQDGSSGYGLDGVNGTGYSYAGLPVMAPPTASIQALPQPPVIYGSYGYQPVGYVGVPPYWYGR
jgi:hypothetical protein